MPLLLLTCVCASPHLLKGSLIRQFTILKHCLENILTHLTFAAYFILAISDCILVTTLAGIVT